MWSAERAAIVSGLGNVEESVLAVVLMIEQMLDMRLTYPEGVFSHALFNRGYREHGLGFERVRKLVPVLRDEAYSPSIRRQAIEFVLYSEAGHPDVFEGALLAIYQSDGEGLSDLAGDALIGVRSSHGADVLSDIIESDRYRQWPRSWGFSAGSVTMQLSTNGWWSRC